MNVQNEENYCLTPDDINKIVGSYCLLIKYPDLSNYDYNSFMKLFKNNKEGFILFFETKNANVGHYECCFKNSQGINFFDSYGLYPDKAESYLSANKRIQLGETKPLLTKLLNECMDNGWKCRYNNIEYQQMDSNISTCGRYCAVRLKNSHLTDSQFYAYMESMKKRFDAKTMDEAITKLTSNLIGK